ncbi:MAG: potassium transporter TrkA, partial [Halobacteriaceae archaeon]
DGLPLTIFDPMLRIVGLGIIAGLVAMIISISFQWYTRNRVPEGLAMLCGLAAIALYLNVKTALGEVVAGETDLFALNVVVYNIAAFAIGGAATKPGILLGERIATNLYAVGGVKSIDGNISSYVKRLSGVRTVTLPEDIDDIDGYDPVAKSVKDELAGLTLVLPERLSGTDLRDHVVTRLKDEHDIGFVDIELDEGDTINRLAIGRRVAGIGPSIAPGMSAVAISADPPNSAGPGDQVQIWTGEPPEVAASGELRAISDDTVTVVVDAQEAPEVAGKSTRLVTLPVSPRPEREFGRILRAADETIRDIKIEPESDLDGRAVGDLPVTVVAISSPSAPIETVPPRARKLAPGDTIYVVARPEDIRETFTAATSTREVKE